MKKQIVLSVSVLMLAVSADLFAPPTSFGRKAANPQINNQNLGNNAGGSIPLTAEAAAQSCTLNDVAAALQELNANPNNATAKGTAIAKSYITQTAQS